MPTHWKDIFLTTPDAESNSLDDVFVAPVMSVAVQWHREVDGSVDLRAKPVEGGSNWLALAFPDNATEEEVNTWRDLETGDLIRVGTAAVGAFTEYLTVLEVVDVDALFNASDTSWEIKAHDPTTSGVIDLTRVLNPYGHENWILRADAFSLTGVLRCVRINHSIDASTLPSGITRDSTNTEATQATRGHVSTFYQRSGTRSYDGASRREQFFYPCYKQRETERDSTYLRMPSDVGMISAIQLIGYAMRYKRAPGTQAQHEIKHDDWFALRIKEVSTNNTVLSNNRHADGALHVIHCGHDQLQRGSVELFVHEPDGIACMRFSPTNLPSLTIEVIDKNGKKAHFGRMDIWLRILVNF